MKRNPSRNKRYELKRPESKFDTPQADSSFFLKKEFSELKSPEEIQPDTRKANSSSPIKKLPLKYAMKDPVEEVEVPNSLLATSNEETKFPFRTSFRMREILPDQSFPSNNSSAFKIEEECNDPRESHERRLSSTLQDTTDRKGGEE